MDVSGIVRRGVHAYVYVNQRGNDNDKPGVPAIPTWVNVMVATTFFGFFFVMFMINYTLGRVIPTLLIVESPDALFDPLPTIDPDSDAPLDPNAAVDAERVGVKQEAITSSFRKTLRLLHSKGGFPARFRGFSIFIVTEFLLTSFTVFFSSIPFVPASVALIMASLILANFSMAWTHIVVSEPSPKRWYRRIPSMSVWKKIALPTAVAALAKNLTFLLPMLLAKLYHFENLPNNPSPMTGGQAVIIILKVLSIFLLSIVMAFIFTFPANVVLTRVQASLLDDADETIVPFDRSFGGKVVPEIVGGTGVISMVDAWKTFDWASRIRLVKAYAKVIALQFIVMVLFVAVLAIEIFAIAQVDLKKLLPDGGSGDGEF